MIIMAVTGLSDSCIVEMGVAHLLHCILQKSRKVTGILPKSQGHRGFPGQITLSRINLGSHKLYLVAAVSIAHIEVTTPWLYLLWVSRLPLPIIGTQEMDATSLVN